MIQIMDKIKTCPVCNRTFTAQRATKVYCSSACRGASHRKQKLEDDLGYLIEAVRMAPPHLTEPKPATVNNIADTIMLARSASTALRRHAMTCSHQLRPACMKVSRGIDDILKEVGL